MNFVPAQVEAIHVIINNSVFSPAETKAKAGDMVTSINRDIVAHTATVHGGFDVAIETHTSASLVLTKAGPLVLLPLPSQHEGTDYNHAALRRPRIFL